MNNLIISESYIQLRNSKVSFSIFIIFPGLLVDRSPFSRAFIPVVQLWSYNNLPKTETNFAFKVEKLRDRSPISFLIHLLSESAHGCPFYHDRQFAVLFAIRAIISPVTLFLINIYIAGAPARSLPKPFVRARCQEGKWLVTSWNTTLCNICGNVAIAGVDGDTLNHLSRVQQSNVLVTRGSYRLCR